MPTRIQIAKSDIVDYFDSLEKKIFARAELNGVFLAKRNFWRLAKSMSVEKFLEFMLLKTKLKRMQLNFPNRQIIRFIWGSVTPLELVMSFHQNCYLSHFTAMHLHELTDQIPKMLYVNCEQKPKFKDASSLTQNSINIAFAHKTRLSNNIIKYNNYQIRLLNGMFTGNAGVITITGPEGENLRVTDIERTLIDITVRPEYAGGVFQVLNAYRLARSKVSINKLTALLRKLDFMYPYHQVIGFYLEKAGVYSATQIDLLKKFEMRFDFYLAHKIENTKYLNKWRLFYPKGMK
jgi:predicted transcriptional regulator of viral defense system